MTSPGDATLGMPTGGRTIVPRHHWVVRVTHWINVVALGLMITSGLRIFNAYPAFARKGESFCCYPFEGTPIPAWLTFGGWLAGEEAPAPAGGRDIMQSSGTK